MALYLFFYSLILVFIEFIPPLFYFGPFHIYLSLAFLGAASLFYKKEEIFPAAFLNGIIFDSLSVYSFGIYTLIFLSVVFSAGFIKPQILPRAKPIFSVFLVLFFLFIIYGIYLIFNNFNFFIFSKITFSFLATGIATFIFAIIFKKNAREKI